AAESAGATTVGGAWFRSCFARSHDAGLSARVRRRRGREMAACDHGKRRSTGVNRKNRCIGKIRPPERRLEGASMAVHIKNLNAALGAEVAGVDLSKPLPQADIDAIEAAWRERLVVVFHGQNLSDPQLIAFSRNFGELDPPGPNPYGEPFNKAHPELNVISNVIENGKPAGNLGDGEAVWHADMTYVEVPPKAALLHALEVPPPEAGGNTYFADMFAAYETLPAAL